MAKELTSKQTVSRQRSKKTLNVHCDMRPISPLPDEETGLSGDALEYALRQIPVDFWISSIQKNKVVFQSDASVEMWGDLQGQEIARLNVPTELVAELQENIDNALTGRNIEYETIVPVTARQKRIYNAKITPLYDDDEDTIGVLGICQDITEQREKNRFLVVRRRLAEKLNATSSFDEALKLCFSATLGIQRIQKAILFTVDEGENASVVLYKGELLEFFKKNPTTKIPQKIKDAAAEGEPLIRNAEDFQPEIADSLRAQNIKQVMQFPMCHDGQVVALLTVGSIHQEELPVWYMDELRSIASQTEATIVRIRTQEKLEADRRLLRELLKMQERERQLISSEIHDGFVQEVIGAQMVLETLSQACSHNQGNECPAFFKQANSMLGRSIKEARRFISDLRPLIIEEAGVVEAIDFLIHRPDLSSKMKIHYTNEGVIERFSPILEEVVFRIVQEAISNSIKHSQGTEIEIHLAERRKRLTLRIADDGVGFHLPEAIKHGFGICGIIERASLFGGAAKIESKPDQGTKIFLDLPIIRVQD